MKSEERYFVGIFREAGVSRFIRQDVLAEFVEFPTLIAAKSHCVDCEEKRDRRLVLRLDEHGLVDAGLDDSGKCNLDW